MAIDISKTYATRSGRPVRLLLTDGGGDMPVIGAIFFDADGDTRAHWEAHSWTAGGVFNLTCGFSDPLGLREVPVVAKAAE